jgi:hypothetical protein
MSATSPLIARFTRLERMARTANGLPRSSLRDAAVTEPVVMSLVKAEVVTDETGRQFVLA